VSSRLIDYRRKRHFQSTPEPKATGHSARQRPAGGIFVVQEHHARRLHYDFRLQMGGVLKSWAVPKGPSSDPAQRRLAVHVEDHPLEYAAFQGVIPKGQYGAGRVDIWDRGYWSPEGDPEAAYRKGHLRFTLRGEKLRGGWSLVAMGRDRKNWLLIKHADPKAQAPDGIPGARPAELPAGLSPQLATLVERPPSGDDWLHEIKFDGYRILAFWDGRRVRLVSRQGNDWTTRFAEIGEALAQLDPRPWLMDGEIVVLDERGRSDFQALQNAMNEIGRAHV
jgi:bifunctional non-homologous end joining protein LigD